MAVLDLLQYPHNTLKLQAQKITTFDHALAKTVEQLFETMYQKEGIGLAAPQVGHSLRICVIDLSTPHTQPLCLINPIITKKEGLVSSEEACLSLPGIHAKVKRAQKVWVEYQDIKGDLMSLTAEDLLAFCIQHELDHLEGILYIDRLPRLKRHLLLKKYEKEKKAMS